MTDLSLIPQNRVENLSTQLGATVNTSGNQTISGTKTFNSKIVTTVQGESIDLIRKSTSDTSGTAFADLQFKDTQNNRKGGIRNIIENGNTTLMYVTNEAGNAIKGTIGIGYNESNNSVFTSAPTPVTSDNSTQIATTAFVKNQEYAVDSNTAHNTGNETIAGTKTFVGNTNDALKMIISNTSGQNCRLQLRDSTTTYGDSGIEIFQATSNNFNQFLIHFMNGNKYPFHIDQDSSDSSIFNTYINGKHLASFVTTTYKSGANWYKVYSDGWIEQGGRGSITTSGLTVTFLKAFSDTNYTLLSLADRSSAGSVMDGVGLQVLSKATNNFKIANKNYGSSNTVDGWWYACGY